MMPRRSFLMAALLFGASAVLPPAAVHAASSKCEGNPGSLLDAIASFNVDADYTEDYAELPIAVTRQAGAFTLSLTTSSLRSVGIPTRLVTNLGSAHESAKSDMVSTTVYRPSRSPSLMTAPSAVVLTKEGTYDAAKSKDVIWNFHVWNESWHLAAPGASTAGAPEWNAYDSTPQETASSSEAGVPGYPVASIPDVKSCSTCTFVQSKGTEPFPTKVSVSGK
ncbi:MAG: transglutaminase domain-containing protein [Myxococcota bacterium]